MDRYLTMAIFVLILVVSIGSANSYFLEKQKAMRAKLKNPPKVEKVQKDKKIAKVEEVEEEFLQEEEEAEEIYFEEEYNPVEEVVEEPVYEKVEPEIAKPVVQEPQTEKTKIEEPIKVEKKKEKSKKIDLSKFKLKKKQAEEEAVVLDDKPTEVVLKVVDKRLKTRKLQEIDGVPIENLKTCKVSKDNRVAAPCLEDIEFFGNCGHIVIVSEGSDSQTKEYLGSKGFKSGLHQYMEASSDGYEMSLALAEKVCKDKYMRVPTTVELYHLYKASKEGCGDKFKPVRYWSLDAFNVNNHTFCNMSDGKCLRRKNPELEGVLHRVRCVE